MEHDPLGHSHDTLLSLIESRELRQHGVVVVGHFDDDWVLSQPCGRGWSQELVVIGDLASAC